MPTNGQPGPGQQQNVTDKHKALHDFAGEWHVAQKIWSAPNSNPVAHRGKTKCSVLLDGAATLMITEMETSNFRGVALMTYNSKQSRYDLAWVDTISDEGILRMGGQPSQAPSRADLQAEFGQGTTQQREWTTAVAAASACLPSATLRNVSQFAAGGARPAAAVAEAVPEAAEVPLRLVENKVSDNRWVLEFFAPGPDGAEFLVQQNTFTRAGHHH